MMTEETAISIIESIAGATDTSTPFGEAVECMRSYIHGLETALDAHRSAVAKASRYIVDDDRRDKDIQNDVLHYEAVRSRLDVDSDSILAAAIKEQQEKTR